MQNESQYDLDRMEAEVDAEQYVGEDIMQAGHGVILPLANSIGMEDSDLFTGNEFVEMDLTIMRSLKPERSFIVTRPGWETSQGATMELAEAQRLGWGWINLAALEPEEFWVQLKHVLDTMGPCTFYVAGKYRHWATADVVSDQEKEQDSANCLDSE